MVVIPFSSLPNFTETVVLETSSWVLGFRWNSGFKFWAMSISNADGPQLDGIKLVPFVRLLKPHAKDNLPSGDFIIMPPANSNNPIGRKNLGPGLDWEIWYIDSSELTNAIV